MSVRCPDGHESTESDYCSVCGLALGGPTGGGAAAPVSASPPAAAPAASGSGGGVCGNCGEAHGPDDVFCENCGFDFVSETLPEPDPEPARTSIASGADPLQVATGEVLATLIVTTDAAHHARMGSEGVLAYPDPERAPVVIEIRTPVMTIGPSPVLAM